MLRQIRKMTGLVVALMRNCAPDSSHDVAFRKDVNLNVPTAPEVGLYLYECMFTSRDGAQGGSCSLIAFIEQLNLSNFLATWIMLELRQVLGCPVSIHWKIFCGFAFT